MKNVAKEVTNGMAAVDLVLSTVEMVARGEAIRITASTQPVYPIRGAVLKQQDEEEEEKGRRRRMKKEKIRDVVKMMVYGDCDNCKCLSQS